MYRTAEQNGRRRPASRLGALVLCAALCGTLCAEDHVTAEQVQAALDLGAQAALRDLDGRLAGANIGYTSICVMALLNAGIPRDHPRVAAAIKQVIDNADGHVEQYAGSYQCAVVNMLLLMLKDPAHTRLAQRMATKLIGFQQPNGGWGDNSRTQYALLGLKSARDLGIDVPAEVFRRAKFYLEFCQNKQDGSWSYGSGGNGYGSMTTAGVSSLFICNEQSYKEQNVCGGVPNDAPMQKALGWLGRNFSVATNPGRGEWHFYYLYALERIGVLTGQRYIGTHDWYIEGADYLVRNQGADGRWGNEQLGTEFALLFLGKGREPVVMQKLIHNGDWNSDPYDAKDLAAAASRDLKMPMTVQTVSSAAGAQGLAAAPILYLQGHRAFTLDPAAREAIRTFVENGGFVFASACCGSGGFDKSFRAEMAAIFPDSSFEPLPPDHEIFNNTHVVRMPANWTIEGLNTGCRTGVFYAPHDLCCGWGSCRGCKDTQRLAPAEAKKLGVNMIAYALNFKKMRDKLDLALDFGKAPAGSVQRNALIIGQLYHNGDWNPDPGSIPNLTQTLKHDIGMKGLVAKKQVVVGTDELGDYPLLYLTGHRKFSYTPEQIETLRTYLNRGGFLFADPCCGRDEFDVAFRKLCTQLYPAKPLAILPQTHSVLRQPYVIDKVTYKPMAKKLYPKLGDTPQFEGISSDDGRLLILYSRFNFGCELQGHRCANCIGISTDDAYHIAVNAVNYALSH